MDWSSFWPDMLVAALTTGVIAALVLFAEHRIAKRAAKRAVLNAQTQVVQQAALLLDRNFTYAYRKLEPDTKNLRKLRKLVRAVPAGKSAEPVRPYRYAEGTSNADDVLRIRIEAIHSHIDRYSAMPGLSRDFVHGTFVDHARKFADSPDDERAWDWTGLHYVFNDSMQAAIESDAELAEALDAYVIQRKALHTYRNAFILANSGWRVHEWGASVAAQRGDPRWPVRWWRELRRRSFVAAAKRKADAEAAELIARIEPIDGYP